MAGWHHCCHGRELRQTSRDGEGQGGLMCYSHVVAESDTTGCLNRNICIYLHIDIHLF